MRLHQHVSKRTAQSFVRASSQAGAVQSKIDAPHVEVIGSHYAYVLRGPASSIKLFFPCQALNWRSFRHFLFLLFSAPFARADVVVGANTSYFSNWTFATGVSPKGTGLPAGTVLTGTLGNQPFTLTASTGSTPPLDFFRSYVDGAAQYFSSAGTDALPANIGLDTSGANASWWDINRGELVYQFTAALPVGTTIFSHDYDPGDSVVFRFYRCDGSQIDASGFNYMQVSTVNPGIINRPSAGSADSYWEIIGNSSPNSSDMLSGLQITDAGVCRITTLSNDSTNGTVDFTLGQPAASSTNAVPMSNPLALILLSMGLGWFAWRRKL